MARGSLGQVRRKAAIFIVTANGFQSRGFEQGQAMRASFDQAALFQLATTAVGMDMGNAQGFGDELLRDRHRHAVGGPHAAGHHPLLKFDQQMRDPAGGVERADSKDLLLEKPFVLSAEPAKGRAQPRRLAERVHELGAWKFRQSAIGDQFHAGIAFILQRAVKADAVAGQQEIDDLTMSVRRRLKTDGPAGDDDAGELDPAPFALHDAPGGIVSGPPLQPIEDRDVLVVHDSDPLQSRLQ